MKPHLCFLLGSWWCIGGDTTVFGVTPRDAWEIWQEGQCES